MLVSVMHLLVDGHDVCRAWSSVQIVETCDVFEVLDSLCVEVRVELEFARTVEQACSLALNDWKLFVCYGPGVRLPLEG